LPFLGFGQIQSFFGKTRKQQLVYFGKDFIHRCFFFKDIKKDGLD